MKATLGGMMAAVALTTATSTTYGESQLPLNEVVEPGLVKTFGHQSSVVMVDGFWAKAGSDVTLSIVDLSSTLIQMATPVPIPTDSPTRVPAGPELTGSPGTGSVVVEIGDNVSLPNPVSYYAVNAIGIEEEGNNPCRITLWGRMVDPEFESGGRKLALFELQKCLAPTPLGTTIDFKLAELPKASGSFARGIRACGGHQKVGLPQEASSSLSWEIKGLTVRAGRVVTETDEVIPLATTGQFVRPNCVDNEAGVYGPGWTGWHECPTGQLMTGVRVHRYEDQWFTGLSAICKKPQRSLLPRKPVKDEVGF